MVVNPAQLERITAAGPRQEAVVTFADGTVLSGPLNLPLEAYMRAWHGQQPAGSLPPLAAIVDGALRELTIPVTRDMTVEPLTHDNSDAARMYRRSLVFLLTYAAHELFPKSKIEVDHALPSGAFYCEVVGRSNFSAEELRQLEDYMRTVAAEDVPVRRERIPLDEAVAKFIEWGDDDKLRLLEYRDKDYLMMYFLRDYADYFFGYMVPSTGYLRAFKLMHSEEIPGGFLLLYPRRESPDRILPYQPSYQIAQVFSRQQDWLDKLQLQDVGHLNHKIKAGRAREVILVAEALHELHIAQIAGEIAEKHGRGARLVLVAGPSSSGKTTFAKRLGIQLLAHGLQPYTLELDRYFVDRDKTPRDPDGEYDFESLGALNLDMLNEQLLALMAGQPVQVPYFDFLAGKSLLDGTVKLTADHVLIVEGIHGLNPALIPDIPAWRIFRVYISALTQLNIDRHNRIPTTDVRLLRRLVRDATYRGYDAEATLSRWPSVRRGEKRNIFPFQENADVMFNSALVYELAVLRRRAEPLLLQVPPGTRLHIEAKRLLSFLSWVRPIEDETPIPANSLLREFVGGSILRDYLPGGYDTASSGH